MDTCVKKATTCPGHFYVVRPREAAELRRLYRRLVHHGRTTFSSPDGMRYLGKRIPLSGDVPQRFSGEVVSDLNIARRACASSIA